jgi:colanic acid/amylovoran biosynthesis glycosyltransferase
VGRLAPVKAVHVLINAVGRLAAEGRRIRLRVIGDGPERGALERRATSLGIQHLISFEGWQNHDAVHVHYQSADLFVLASFAEGVPVVLMEAMAMEIPCVSTWVAGIPELITDGVSGLLVAPSDEEGLTQAIRNMLDDGGLRRRLGTNARLTVLAEYDLDTNFQHLAQIMRRRLGTHTTCAE